MKGNIYLVQLQGNKIIPALYLGDCESDALYIAQIKKASEEDIFNAQELNYMQKYNRGRAVKNQIKIRQKYEINNVFIGKPEGMNYISVVLVSKVFSISRDQIVKKISHVPEEIVTKCLEVHSQLQKIRKLKQQLGKLKKRIELAKINNERHSDLEKQFEKIRKEIGYPDYRKKSKAAYLHYRGVPNNGFVKIYRG